MVRGAVAIVTPVSGTNQCAETLRIALGRSTRSPICFHASVYSFVRSAFIGFPCPKKIAGSLFMRNLWKIALVAELGHILPDFPLFVRDDAEHREQERAD